MAIFKRGISNKNFIESLNNLYSDKKSFWHKIVNDKELFIGIRDEYLNVYYNGQSLCLLTYNKGIVEGKTHKKYMGLDEGGYIKSRNGLIIEQKATISNLSEISIIKSNIRSGYIGKEKVESYREVIDHSKHVIDVEITFVHELVSNPHKKSDYQTSSIDYLVLDKNKLVFYEAKHFNSPEIRSNATPRVLHQIERYARELLNHKSEIENAYQTVLQNRKDLNILNDVLLPDNLEIDTQPYLIVFATDRNRSNDSHLQKLKMHLQDRLILKYKPD